MASSPKLWLAFIAGLASLFSGCCGIQCVSPCGGFAGNCGGSNLLHGEIARRVKTAVVGGCCSGCGEVYCDEQINEPPTCDPCGCNGEFTGESCGPCRPLWQRMKMLMGTPYIARCGCDDCDQGCGQDAYASEHNGSGYCPSCRDGVAGSPHRSVMHSDHGNHANHANPTSEPAMSKAVKSDQVGSEPSQKIEPTPDPLSRTRSRKPASPNDRRQVASRMRSE